MQGSTPTEKEMQTEFQRRLIMLNDQAAAASSDQNQVGQPNH